MASLGTRYCIVLRLVDLSLIQLRSNDTYPNGPVLFSRISTPHIRHQNRKKQMTETVDDEYGAAIGSVMQARRQYEAACAAQGADSWAARQAHEYLTREIEHRDAMRARHDAAPDHRRGE